MYTLPSPIQQLHDPIFLHHEVKLFLKRDDLLHPLVSGNKWRKLKYNLEAMRKERKQTILSFGGAYSNHIYSLAAAGKLYGFKTIGIIRGEETLPLNDTLHFATECGMEIHYLSREEYRNKENEDFLKQINEKYNHPYLLPEGGSNALAVKGCEEIIGEISMDFDFICCACGSGGTISGIARSLKGKQKVLGISALKGAGILDHRIMELSGIPLGQNWEVNYDYHFGGYAKYNADLLDFIRDFKKKQTIQLEQVYTGKQLFGIFDLIKKGYFEKNSTIVAVHTGGIQGLKKELIE